MTTPKTEAERIDEAAKLAGTLTCSATREIGRNFFKAGVAWRDANLLPHPDTVRLEWMIKNKKMIYKNDSGGFWLVDSNGVCCNLNFEKSAREAIDAAIGESKK